MPVEIAEVLVEKITARHSEMTRGRCGSDGLGTLTGYVFFGKQPDQLFLVKMVGQAQKAA